MTTESKRLQFLRALDSNIRGWQELQEETMFMGSKDTEEIENNSPLSIQLKHIIMERFHEVHGSNKDIPEDIFIALGFKDDDERLEKRIQAFSSVDIHLPFVVRIHWRSFSGEN